MANLAKLKFVRIPPRKARLVADMVRGKSANEAASLLKFTPNKGAKYIDKVLKSAIANASSTGKVDVDSLYIEKICIDPGPIMKRFTARAQGRGTRVNKRTSHITVVLGEK